MAIFATVEPISLTAFFPAYNDQHTIEPIVRTAADEMRKVTDDFEVLVVDDGSKDETGAILDRLAAELPYLRVIHHERNLGYGAALFSIRFHWSPEAVSSALKWPKNSSSQDFEWLKFRSATILGYTAGANSSDCDTSYIPFGVC